MALSNAWLKANLHREVPESYERAYRDGLSVRVSPKGKITFQLRYRFAGKPQRLKIGTYPEMSLLQAKEEGERLRNELNAGHDPRFVKSAEKLKAIKSATFEVEFTGWFKKYRWGEIKMAQQYLRSFEIYIFPVYGSMPPNRISTLQWIDLFDKVAKKPSIAKRVIDETKGFYRWGHRVGLYDSNPVGDLLIGRDFKIKKNKSTRNLDHADILKLFKAFRLTNISLRNCIMYELVLHTGCRTIELRMAKREHFDMEKRLWTVPGDMNKQKEGGKVKPPIVRPIIDAWVPMLEYIFKVSENRKWLFGSEKTGQLLRHSTVHSSAYGFNHFIRERLKEEIEHWTLHDLRRTTRTMASRYVRKEIAEKMLGHQVEGMAGVYDQYLYVDEMRVAYEAIAAEISEVVGDYSFAAFPTH